MKFYKIFMFFFNFIYSDVTYQELLKYIEHKPILSYTAECVDSQTVWCQVKEVKVTNNELFIHFIFKTSIKKFSYSIIISEHKDGELFILKQDYHELPEHKDLYNGIGTINFLSRNNEFKIFILHSNNTHYFHSVTKFRIRFYNQLPIKRDQEKLIERINLSINNIQTDGELLIEKKLSEIYDYALKSKLLVHNLSDQLDSLQFDPKVCYPAMNECLVKAMYFIDKLKVSLLIVEFTCIGPTYCIILKDKIDWFRHFIVYYKNKTGEIIIIDPFFGIHFKQNFHNWYHNFTFNAGIDMNVFLYNPIYVDLN